jgi:hypothetical protein
MNNSISPFAAPAAELGEATLAPRSMRRPPQVTQALAWLWVDFALSMAKSAVLIAGTSAFYVANGVREWPGLTLLAVLLAGVIWALRRGHGWARYGYLLLALGSLAEVGAVAAFSLRYPGGAFAGFAAFMRADGPHASLAIVDAGVCVFVAVMLFTTPANEWFRNMRKRKAR